EQYDLIESCSPGPYLELFARHPKPKWTLWGDESSEGQAPRGKVHKGYAGGEILPQLGANEHIQPGVAVAIGAEPKSRYQNGSSVREISDETGYSIQRVRSLLAGANTPMRPRGRQGK